MTDLDNTQIISADDSLLQNTSIIDSEASLKIISGTDSNTYQIGKETIVGRTNPSDLIIAAPSLSKQHAKITINNGQYFVTDLGSSNKTFHNKVQLQPNVCYALHDGDELKFGDIICSFQQQKPTQTENKVVTQSNADVIPSTQTISDSYDDQEPTQPMKIWNGNTNNSNGVSRTSIKSSDDESLKQNGVGESSTNKSSSFIPQTSSSMINDDNDNDDDGLVIGAATLPATVPIIVESTQIKDDGEVEIISSTRTEQTIEEDNDKVIITTTTTTTEIDISDTQAYELEATSEKVKPNEQIGETQSYELESEPVITDIVETKREEVHQVFVEGDKVVEEDVITTITTTTKITENENIPMDTIAYNLQPSIGETTTTTTKTTVLKENEDLPMETQAYDLQATTEEIKVTTANIHTENEELPTEALACDLEHAKEKVENLNTNVDLPSETQAYNLEPTVEEITTTATVTPTTIDTEKDNLPQETLAYDLESANEKGMAVIENENTQEKVSVDHVTSKYEESNKNLIEKNDFPGETLAYDLQPTTADNVESSSVDNVDLPMETQAYELKAANDKVNFNVTTPALCTDTQKYDLDEQVDDLSPRPASETCEVVPMSELAEQIQKAENVADDSPPKQQIEVTINRDLVEKDIENEQMETDYSESESKIIDYEARTIEEQNPENTNTLGNEVLSATSTDISANKESVKNKENNEPSAVEQDTAATADIPNEPDQSLNQTLPTTASEDVPSSTIDTTDTQAEEVEENEEDEQEEGEAEESAPVSGRVQRGMPRRAARRARGRRGGTARARVVSTRLHSARRNAIVVASIGNESNNATLEETVNTEAEESPKKLTTSNVELKRTDTQPISEIPTNETTSPAQTSSASNIRVSARIKARASSGRNRQFPYTDDYVDLDDLEKQSKALPTPTPSPAPTTTTPTASARRSTRGGRSSSASQKRISLRQQPIDTAESPEEKNKKQKSNIDVYEQMDTGGENEEPTLAKRTPGRKRKSTTSASPAAVAAPAAAPAAPAPTTTATKRTRSATPQTPPVVNTRGKQASTTDLNSSVTPKRGRKSAKLATPTTESPEKQSVTDRPVRIALSSHLNFDQSHIDALRKLGFEIMDESCHVDALVVDRIRRTKKFFMCLARGAHILSPTWIEAMIKENRYLPYDKYYLEDTNAETRYGFQLRESVRLAKQHPIFENYKIYCTKDTSPPYDDLKDIVEAAGGKFIDKINFTKPGKDLICIVAQAHKSEYENLYKKGVPIVSEEFALSGISKQKLDFEAFSLFQTATNTIKATGSK